MHEAPNSDPNTEASDINFSELAEVRNLAERAKDQVAYAGFFIGPEELYRLFPPSLSQKILSPHVTTAYRPDVTELFLDALGSSANIKIIGYANDGQNEGLLVEVEAENPEIQKFLNERVAPDKNGELKPVPTHITLSINKEEGAKAVNTRNLEFTTLDEPISISGTYKLFGKNGVLIDQKDYFLSSSS